MITNIVQRKLYEKLFIYDWQFLFVCLYVSTATKEGAKRLDCAGLTLLKRNDQIEMEWIFKSFIKVWTFRNSVIFYRVSRKKRYKKRLIRKMKNCNFVGTMSLLKREIAKKMDHRKTQNFLNATMYGARLVPHILSSVLNQNIKRNKNGVFFLP